MSFFFFSHLQKGLLILFFFFQAEDGIRDVAVTGFRRVLFRSDPACDPGVCNTTCDPDNEGFACQRQEWLAREAAGSEPRRNHTEDGHGGRYKSRAAESSLWGSGEETSIVVSGYGPPALPRLTRWRGRCGGSSRAAACRAPCRWTRGGIAPRTPG